MGFFLALRYPKALYIRQGSVGGYCPPLRGFRRLRVSGYELVEKGFLVSRSINVTDREGPAVVLFSGDCDDKFQKNR